MSSLASSPAGRASALTAGIWALAGVQAVIGLAQVLAPGSFYDAVANFGPRNDHFLRDVASYYLASAAALAVTWIVPLTRPASPSASTVFTSRPSSEWTSASVMTWS